MVDWWCVWSLSFLGVRCARIVAVFTLQLAGTALYRATPFRSWVTVTEYGVVIHLSLPPSPPSLPPLPPSLPPLREEKERMYQEEMDRLEREQMRALEEESLERKRTIESDQAIQNLDQVQYTGYNSCNI